MIILPVERKQAGARLLEMILVSEKWNLGCWWWVPSSIHGELSSGQEELGTVKGFRD